MFATVQVKLVSQFRCDETTLAFWERAVQGRLTTTDISTLEGLRRSVDDIDPRRCLILVALKSRQVMYHNTILIQQRRLHCGDPNNNFPADVVMEDDAAEAPVIRLGSVSEWNINNAEDRDTVEETAMPLWPELKLRK